MGQLERESGRVERFCKACNWGTAFQVFVKQVVSSVSQAMRVKVEKPHKI